MIRALIAISMEANPGRAVVAACPLAARPTVRTCRLDDRITNVHAYWFALDLALARLAGRPAVISTNCTSLVRTAEYGSGWTGIAYQELADGCIARCRATGSKVVHVRTNELAPQCPERDGLRWLGQRAREDLEQWFADEASHAAEALQ